MINIEELKAILGRKVKLNDGKRTLNINIGETAREMGCSSSDVLFGLKQLQYAREIKKLIGLVNENYTLTIMSQSNIRIQ